MSSSLRANKLRRGSLDTTTVFVYLEANQDISGDLRAAFCSSPFKKPVVVADCELCDVAGECCDRCCPKGEECNEGFHIPDMDPIWQFGYQRQIFNTRSEDYFPQEMYELQDEEDEP